MTSDARCGAGLCTTRRNSGTRSRPRVCMEPVNSTEKGYVDRSAVGSQGNACDAPTTGAGEARHLCFDTVADHTERHSQSHAFVPPKPRACPTPTFSHPSRPFALRHTGQVISRVLVDQESHTRARQDPDDIRPQALVEPAEPFPAPHLPDHIPRARVRLPGLVRLQPRTDDLVRVGQGAGEDLGQPAQQQVVDVAQFSRPACRSCGTAGEATGPLQPLVSHELQRAVRDAEEGGHQAAVEAGEPFGAEDLPRAVEDGGVGSRVLGGGREHACFDHPDRVRREGRQGSCVAPVSNVRRGHGGANHVPATPEARK